jgi:hypothetical protein
MRALNLRSIRDECPASFSPGGRGDGAVQGNPPGPLRADLHDCCALAFHDVGRLQRSSQPRWIPCAGACTPHSTGGDRIGTEARQAMRGKDDRHDGLFSYVRPDSRIPQDHPLRPIRRIADAALHWLSAQFDGLYAKEGRPSIPPEKLLRALLLQAFYYPQSVKRESCLTRPDNPGADFGLDLALCDASPILGTIRSAPAAHRATRLQTCCSAGLSACRWTKRCGTRRAAQCRCAHAVCCRVGTTPRFASMPSCRLRAMRCAFSNSSVTAGSEQT